MSAKSEELEGLREGEPTDDPKGAESAQSAPDALDETLVVDKPQAVADKAVVDNAVADKAVVDKGVIDNPVADNPVADKAGADEPAVAQGLGVTDPLAATHLAPAAPVDVPSDVAQETARVMAEASGGAVDSGIAVPAEAPAGAADGDAAPAFPGRRDRHTPLYGRGKRILPWRHKSRLAPKQRRRRKIIVRSLWGCVLIVVGTVGWSIAGALTTPGTDTVQARLAEWGRDHGLGGVVSTLEKWQYDLDPPKKGGAVDARQFSDLGPTAAPGAVPPASSKPGKTGSTPGKGGATSPAADVIAMQARLAAPPGLTLEGGEGVFQVAVQTADGQPVVQVARIRPDAEYTDVAADVVWIDQKHSRYVLHPGHEGDLNKTITTVPNQIDADARPGLIALFNGGFKISESHGGYFDHGVTAAALVDGAASEVIFKDGHMSVGLWGRDYSMQKNPDIVSVRQNLRLMVDGGQVVPYINESANWGRSDHGSAAVWRSGVGVTAAGDVVWVGGNKLTAPSLARLLKDAGAVRGMQLDINLRWADFQYFPGRDGNPDNSKLYEDFLQGANKFFVNSTKDFMAVYVR